METGETWCQLSNGVAKVISSWPYTKRTKGEVHTYLQGNLMEYKTWLLCKVFELDGYRIPNVRKICVLSAV